MGAHAYKVQYPDTIPSVNDMYKIGRNGKRVWLYLDPRVDRFKSIIIEQLRDQKIYNNFAQYKDQKVMVNIVVSFCIQEPKFWDRDVTNLIKATEDAFVKACEVDDSKTISFSTEKLINDMDDNEYIVFACEVKPLDATQVSWKHRLVESLREVN